MLGRKTIALMLAAAVVVATAPAAHATVATDFHEGDDPTLVEQITKTVLNVTRDYPEIDGVTVGSGTLPPLFYAFTGNGRITFNEGFVTNRGLLEFMMRNDVATGFHPALGHCTPIEELATHESAHAIDAAHNTIGDTRLVAKYGSGTQLHAQLSGYSFKNDGTINPPEALAEAFASVRCNGGNTVERDLTNMLTTP